MFRYGILGPVEVYDPEGRVLPLGGPRQLRLLALLLVYADQAVSADHLVDALWGGQRARGVDKRVQMAIARLRRALEDAGGAALRTVAGGYRLAVAADELDARVFETTVQDGRRALDAGDPERAAELLGEALALWRGPALAEVTYEDWAQGEIRRLDELRLDALQASVDARLRLGRHAAVVGELEALVAHHPEREQLAGQLMVALYRCGRQRDALEVFQRTRTRLADELGLEPGPALGALQQQILTQDPALLPDTAAYTPPPEREPSRPEPPSSAGRLSAPPTALIGREADIATAVNLLRQPGRRLLTLTGPGGIGKTRLAIAIAHELAAAFSDGVFLVELAGLTDARLVAPALAQTLGLSLEGAESSVAAVERHLRERQTLIVLDNFEHLLPAARFVADLLRTAPDLRVLATSRATLNLLDEQLYEVPPLAIPSAAHASDPETSAESAAVALFVQRARAVDHRFALTAQSAATVSEICARLDGLPLAIELAASWVKLLGPPGLLERLASRLELPAKAPRDLPGRQQSVRATLEWSYRLLEPDVQRLFTRLAVFAGGCTLETAETLCGADVLHELAMLLDHSLLRQHEGQSRQPRFSMLETVREYALELLAAHGEEDALRRRHAECFRALLEQAERQLWGGGQESWLRRLDDEHDNLRAALTWSLRSQEGLLSLQLAVYASQFWLYRSYFDEGRGWLERALNASSEAPPALRAAALRQLSTLARLHGDNAYAKRSGEEALMIFRRVDDSSGLVRVLTNLGAVALAEGDCNHAAQLLDESLDVGRQIGGIELAMALTNRADLALAQGDYKRTLELSEEASELFRTLGNTEGLATARFNSASAALHQERYAAALPSFLESLGLFESIGFEQSIAICLEHVAAVLAAQGAPIDAARLLGAADKMLEAISATRGPAELEEQRATQKRLRHQLGHKAFEAERITGRALTRDQAIAATHKAAAALDRQLLAAANSE